MMRIVPGSRASIGDVYWVNARATLRPVSVGKLSRPMGCVAEQPRDPAVWTAIPRLSSGIADVDAPSRAMPEISPTRLEREGAWSVTGKKGLCDYLGALPDDERKTMMSLYRGRDRGSRR